MSILFDAQTQQVLQKTIDISKSYSHEYVTPEHLLLSLLDFQPFCDSIIEVNGFPDFLKQTIQNYLEQQEKVNREDKEGEEELSVQMELVLNESLHTCQQASAEYITLPIIVKSLMSLEHNFGASALLDEVGGKDEMPYFLATFIDHVGDDSSPFFDDEEEEMESDHTSDPYLIDMNKALNASSRPPLVGREAEIRRTIQVLCRYAKNNPLHIGESGVGKTALVWGLVRMIVEGKVPEAIKNTVVYQLNIGSLIAGSQFRGDMETRLKSTIDRVVKAKGILYIDDIHLIFGSAHNNDGSPCAYDILKPYLEDRTVKVIGTTTYTDYKRNMERNSGLLRHFQKIDIDEPGQEDTFKIAMELKSVYENYHHVDYDDEAVRYAVTESTKHITDRFQPDKTLDLLDEAGAAHSMDNNPSPNITKSEISNVLAKMVNVESLAEHDNDADRLSKLYDNITAQIYGQDEAVRLVVEAIQMAKAGLNDDDKPLASLLFVGPTGVGKTEVSRVLSQQLGIELIRFDMSEYVEKHTVAKLIGSPAGYVGYEDGGLLTDAIRKNPNSVLLLDEVEKAHEDIYNILLQVMDYARLTDNRGQKADFRNVVLIMTSNVGAQFAAQANVGFTGHVTRGEAMIRQVKKTFKPEFLNRLTGVVSFNDMDEHMAKLILKKKLGILETKLKSRGISMNVNETAFNHLLKKGFTKEYGAREIDRVIARDLKPLLMKEILFGSLRNGGTANINYTEENGIQIG